MEKSDFILIADSGATKTDWNIVKAGEIIFHFKTRGISPIFQTESEIAAEIANEVLPQTEALHVSKIRFYGSGCIPEKVDAVKRVIAKSFRTDDIEVHSDMIAAAHALCGHQPGIVSILGTGSNSCKWNGEEISKQISPLGFILGDEGSGAHLGKLLMGDLLKNQLSQDIKEKFFKRYDLSQAEIIDRVYRQQFPSRFLAGFAPFLKENLADPTIYRILEKSFGDFFERNIMQYDYHKFSINFVGSIAFHFSEILHQLAEKKDIRIGKIEQSPMKGLITYYK